MGNTQNSFPDVTSAFHVLLIASRSHTSVISYTFKMKNNHHSKECREDLISPESNQHSEESIAITLKGVSDTTIRVCYSCRVMLSRSVTYTGNSCGYYSSSIFWNGTILHG